MEELLENLGLPTAGERYPDYKARMEAIHGSEPLTCKAIKIKYFSPEAKENLNVVD